MIRRSFRSLGRLAAMRYGFEPGNRAAIRLAYELAGQGEPDEGAYRRHEADLARGLTRPELVRSLIADTTLSLGLQGASADDGPSARVAPEDADALVRLAFQSLLRRDADAETYAAYRAGFEQGTTFLDLIHDITRSEEFQLINERIDRLFATSDLPSPLPPPEHPVAADMGAALTLLGVRLGEKGCDLQLGPTPASAVDGAMAHHRMRSLMITLSLLEYL